MEPFEVRDDIVKLSSTLVMYKGHPYYCTLTNDAYNTGRVKLTDLSMMKVHEVVYTDPDFTTDMPEVGYFKVKNKYHYAYRLPIRTHEMGLRPESIGCDTMNYIGDYIITSNFADMLIDKYPTYDQANKEVESSAMDVCAFHKNAAIGRVNQFNKGLYFNGGLIGLVSNHNNLITVLDHRSPGLMKKKLKSIGVLANVNS